MLWALLKRFRIPVHRYHGGMNATARSTAQRRDLRRGQRPVMLATMAGAGLALLGLGLSTSLWTLFAARIAALRGDA